MCTAIQMAILPSDLADFHMLRAESEPEDPGRNATQDRPALQELQNPRNRKSFVAAKNFPDHIVLDQDLEPLRGSSRKTPPSLNRLKIAFSDVVLPKFWAE